MRADVVLTPAEIALLPTRDLSGATCIVFDVLRATSTMLTALSNGARRIFPVASVQEAWDQQRSRLPGALIGGEQGGRRIDGSDLGNSPAEYRRDVVAGRDIVMTTTNGTVALQACAAAAEVYAGALLNLDALCALIRRRPPERLFLVCAGSGSEFALEDGLAAGALLARLSPSGSRGDACRLVETLHQTVGADFGTALQTSSNGRHLADIGLAADVAYCAQDSSIRIVGELRAGALETVPSV